MARLSPLTKWIKSTRVGQKYLMTGVEDKTGLGVVMRFRDKLVNQRIEDIKAGVTGERIDLLQR